MADARNGIVEWKSCIRQTWSATAFMRMVLMGLIGMDFNPKGIKYRPLIPEGYNKLKLTGLLYRDMILNVYIEGTGDIIKEFSVNGVLCDSHEINPECKGDVDITIIMDK